MSGYIDRDDSGDNGALLDAPDIAGDGKRMNARRIKMRQILDVIESVLKEVFEEYKIGHEECECKPDMKVVEEVALKENMTTHQILSLCSAISRSAKGTFNK
jgi:hypothetical protein